MAQRSKKREDSSSDGKIYYRIGEVSRITGVKPYVLRYWESEFRWMAPAKSRSKQRLYRKRDIEVIQLIKRLLYDERYTIAGARKKLRELGVGRVSNEQVGLWAFRAGLLCLAIAQERVQKAVHGELPTVRANRFVVRFVRIGSFLGWTR